MEKSNAALKLVEGSGHAPFAKAAKLFEGMVEKLSGDDVLGLRHEERTRLVGERYVHSPGRMASRGGHVRGELVLGGRRVVVSRPRARSVDGKELRLETWERFSHEDPLRERAVEQMVIGVSTRKYARSLEAVDAETHGDSKSARA